MEAPKWLIRTKSDNRMYTYFTFEILSIDVSVNGTNGIDIYELKSQFGKVTYVPVTIEEVRNNNKAA